MTFQPVLVPVGRIALGRIFNVVGSIVDRYIDLSLSSQLSTAIPCVTGPFLELRSDLTYTLSYPKGLSVATQGRLQGDIDGIREIAMAVTRLNIEEVKQAVKHQEDHSAAVKHQEDFWNLKCEDTLNTNWIFYITSAYQSLT